MDLGVLSLLTQMYLLDHQQLPRYWICVLHKLQALQTSWETAKFRRRNLLRVIRYNCLTAQYTIYSTCNAPSLIIHLQRNRQRILSIEFAFLASCAPEGMLTDTHRITCHATCGTEMHLQFTQLVTTVQSLIASSAAVLLQEATPGCTDFP